MYYRPRRRYSRSSDYLMPFMIIICVGIIIVLLFNLWKALFSSYSSGDAYMHIESGSVQVKTWTAEEFFDLTSDALVMEGDEIRTSADAKVIIEFFDGTLMRMGGGTDVILKEIDAEEDDPAIDLLLVDGKLWFNKLYKDTGDTEIIVTMDNIVAKSLKGNIFEVENELDEVVRVFRGDKDAEVAVDIKSEDDSKVVETENVGVGQEMVFTDKVLRKYWQYQSPSVLNALSDEFKQTQWYLWNTEEDKSPTEFSKAAILGKDELVEVEPEIIEPEVVEPEVEGEETEGEAADMESEEPAEGEPEEEPTEPVDLGLLTTPTISSVAGGTEVNENGYYVVTGHLATLTGGISGADKVVVNEYTLQQFSPGDETWTYYANANYALMREGENVYEVYALAPDGTRSESIYVKVWYAPPVEEVVEEPAEEEGTPDEGAGTEEGGEGEADSDEGESTEGEGGAEEGNSDA